jgi:hypothetical protein
LAASPRRCKESGDQQQRRYGDTQESACNLVIEPERDHGAADTILKKLHRSTLFEVFERQWCSCLERLDCNVAAHFAHNRQIEELTHQKALVVSEVRHNDFEEVVRLAGDEVASNDLKHFYDRFLERQCTLIGVPVDLDA